MAEARHFQFAGRQLRQDFAERVLEVGGFGVRGRRRGAIILQRVAEGGVAFFAEGRIERLAVLLIATQLDDLLRGAFQEGGDILLFGFAAELLEQRGLGLAQLRKLFVQIARQADGAAKEIQFAHDGAADAPEGVGAEAMAEVGVEVTGGGEEREITSCDELHHLLARDTHLLGGVVGQTEVAVHEFVESGLAREGEAAIGVLAGFDEAAEAEFLFGAEAGPACDLVQVERQRVGLAGAVWGGFDDADPDFTEVGEVGAEEGGQCVGLGGAGGDVVDHVEKERGLYI